jgi:hypothetical protein
MKNQKQKTIYELDLHEQTTIKTTGNGWNESFVVTRVASGWLYQNDNPRRTVPESFFVPFDNSFMKRN